MNHISAFPREINPLQVVLENQVFEGHFLAQDLERFASLLFQPQGRVKVNLSFFEDQAKQVQARLHLKGQVQLQCERCREAMPFMIDEEVAFQCVSTQREMDRLPLSLQPLELNAAHQIEVYPLIEDALILALPAFPSHEKKDCSLGANAAYSSSSEKEQTQSYKPFASLVQLAHFKEKKNGGSTE